MDRVAEVADALELPHREHLIRSIGAGPAPWGRVHDPDLRQYILEQADAAGS